MRLLHGKLVGLKMFLWRFLYSELKCRLSSFYQGNLELMIYTKVSLCSLLQCFQYFQSFPILCTTSMPSKAVSKYILYLLSLHPDILNMTKAFYENNSVPHPECPKGFAFTSKCNLVCSSQLLIRVILDRTIVCCEIRMFILSYEGILPLLLYSTGIPVEKSSRGRSSHLLSWEMRIFAVHLI